LTLDCQLNDSFSNAAAGSAQAGNHPKKWPERQIEGMRIAAIRGPDGRDTSDFGIVPSDELIHEGRVHNIQGHQGAC